MEQRIVVLAKRDQKEGEMNKKMTVADLIKQLKGFPPETEVRLRTIQTFMGSPYETEHYPTHLEMSEHLEMSDELPGEFTESEPVLHIKTGGEVRYE